MTDEKRPQSTRLKVLVGLFVLIAALSNGYFWWDKQTTNDEFTAERNELKKQLAFKDSVISELSSELDLTEEELDITMERLRSEEDRNDAMEDRIEQLAGTVGVLDKLSKLDEELLQKYSKVYFLNENYVPSDLDKIDDEWKYSEDKEMWLHGKVMPFFEDMVEDAKDDGIDLWVVSAFRSFETQAELKNGYSVTYGEGANAFSADQGYSEHQLGTTVDFTTSGINGSLEAFGGTEAHEWLLDNAHKYGFILSYPEGNAYYISEPWHWRFVGEELAKDLHRDDAHFYDWDQRDINEYLINIFD